MKILAIGAHPDDVEFMCAGTLNLLKQRGHDMAIATITTGSLGSATLGPEEISRIRIGEARTSAALIGADYYCTGIPDVEVVFDNPTRWKVVEIVRKAQPDIVFTHYPVDYMADHEMASALAVDAAFNATLGNYPPNVPRPVPKTKRLPHVYYFSPMEGTDHFGQPVPLDIIVDISSVIDRKVEMLCCHASQREWLRCQNGVDEYVEFMKRESSRVGAMRGYAYGEAFRQHRGHAFPHDDVLTRLLAPVGVNTPSC